MEPDKNLKRFVAVLIILILPAALIFAYFRNYSPDAVHEPSGGMEPHAMKCKSPSGGQQPMQMVAPQSAGEVHGDSGNLSFACGRTNEREGRVERGK